MQTRETKDVILAIGQVSDEQCLDVDTGQARIIVDEATQETEPIVWLPRGGIIRLDLEQARRLARGFLAARPDGGATTNNNYRVLRRMVFRLTGKSLAQGHFVVICDVNGWHAIRDPQDTSQVESSIFTGYTPHEFVVTEDGSIVSRVYRDPNDLRSPLIMPLQGRSEDR